MDTDFGQSQNLVRSQFAICATFSSMVAVVMVKDLPALEIFPALVKSSVFLDEGVILFA